MNAALFARGIEATATSAGAEKPGTAMGRRTLPLSRPIIATAGLYGLVCTFFCVVWITGEKDAPLNLATAIVYLAVRATGIVVGISKLHSSGNRRTAASLMLAVFCLAFLLDAIGAALWLTYNLQGSLVPFPSWADVGYGGDTILWAVGLLIFFWVLDTNVRDELGPFVELLAVTWSLTVVLISMINGPSLSKLILPAVVLSIFYPFVWALSAALTGALLFGPEQRRLTTRWRWFVAFVYAGSLLTFLTNIAYSLTAAATPDSPAATYLYYNGGPLDFLFATGDFLLVLAIIVLPLNASPFRLPQRPADHPAVTELGLPSQPRSRLGDKDRSVRRAE
jgi:hypothetical protein